MVKIPTFDSQRTLSTQTTANRITDLATFTQESAALQGAGRAINTIAEDFKKLNDLRQVSKATVETNRQLSDLESRILDDPELSETSAQQFQQEAQGIVNNQLATIDDEVTRLKAGVSFNGTSIVKGFNVKRQGRQADIDNATVESAELTAQALQDSFKAGPAERAIIRSNLQIHFNNKVLGNLTTRKAAVVDLASFDEAVRKGRGQFMLDSMTAVIEGRTIEERIGGAVRFIELVNAGEFSELQTKEQEALVNQSRNFIQRQTQIRKDEVEKKQRINQQQDIEQVIDGSFTETQMREKELREDWSGPFTANAIAYNTSKKAPPVVTDFNEYVRIRKMQTGIKRKDDGSQFTQEEAIAEVLRIGNDSLSGPHQKDLVNKSFDLVGNRSDALQKNNVQNLEARIVERMFGFESDVVEEPIAKRAIINQQLFKYYQRADVIENPTQEQLDAIANDVFNEWILLPVEQGGMGFEGNAEDVPDTIIKINRSVLRLHREGTSKAKSVGTITVPK